MHLSLSSECEVTKLQNLHPYKMQLYEELIEDEFVRRDQFCELMLDIINNKNAHAEMSPLLIRAYFI